MARKQAKNGKLRKCPSCDTPVEQTVNLGLRDYSWVNEHLDAKLGMMDFDAVLTQHKTGRMLVLEFKPKGMYISTGARLSFSQLVKAGYDVWVLWDQEDGNVQLGVCNDQGRVTERHLMSREEAALHIRHWWNDGV